MTSMTDERYPFFVGINMSVTNKPSSHIPSYNNFVAVLEQLYLLLIPLITVLARYLWALCNCNCTCGIHWFIMVVMQIKLVPLAHLLHASIN